FYGVFFTHEMNENLLVVEEGSLTEITTEELKFLILFHQHMLTHFLLQFLHLLTQSNSLHFVLSRLILVRPRELSRSILIDNFKHESRNFVSRLMKFVPQFVIDFIRLDDILFLLVINSKVRGELRSGLKL
ncbi:hypothetical protein PFISCL1PPCAC_23352, partial [Pristionchus fissidentatus]